MKIAVLFAGFAPRSWKYTHKVTYARIIAPLRRAGHDVDVYLYSFLSRSEEMENSDRGDDTSEKLDMDDVKLMPGVTIRTGFQEDFDGQYPHVQFLVDAYGASSARNFHRIALQEKKVYEMLGDKQYDVCVASYTSNLYLNDINLDEIQKVL